MSVFARIVVGVDGTNWGFEALRQALVLAPEKDPVVRAVTALDTAPVHTGSRPHISPTCSRRSPRKPATQP
jgi:hypothetical protein